MREERGSVRSVGAWLRRGDPNVEADQQGSSFPVTVVGILMQLPSGLSNGGIFK